MSPGSLRKAEGACDYCGLPVPGYVAAAPSEEHEPQYCCIGCSFAAKITSESGTAGEERLAMTKLGLAVFFAMSVMVFSLLLWSEQDSQRDHSNELALSSSFYDIARYLSLLFSIPVMFLLGAPVIENAVREVKRGKLSTDLLLAAGVVASFGYSAYHVFVGLGHVYFEVACAILVAVTLGKWLEAHCKRQMTESIAALAKLLPSTVHRVDESGQESEAALAEVRVGELLRVFGGERIAVDGEILRGESLIDEQVLTGESEPVCKGQGQRVFAGALNLDGELLIRSTVAGGQGAIQRIVDAVTEAARAKCKPQLLAERISAWFLPAVMILSLAAFGGHYFYGGLYAGISNALCVVLIACPCALGLATPLAIWAGIGRASREQILVREGDALCSLGDIKVVAFDKTGTLTTGATLKEMTVLDHGYSEAAIASIARRITEGSRHLYSQAIAAEFIEAAPCEMENARTVMGRGMIATLADSKEAAVLGSRRLLLESGCRIAPDLSAQLDLAEAQGLGISLLGIGRSVVASFYFTESLRADAASSITSLRDQGIQVSILSGDHEQRVANIAERLGVPFQAGLLPEEKLAVIGQLRSKHGKVAMVGDGVNDAPALAAADVGIALGCGADVSRDAAAVCLLGNQLSRVGQAIEIGIQTRKTVRWNLLWTFVYNVLGISLAVAGRLHPAVAAGAMVASSLMVVIQSLRLSHLEFVDLKSEQVADAGADLHSDSLHRDHSPLLESSSAA